MKTIKSKITGELSIMFAAPIWLDWNIHKSVVDVVCFIPEHSSLPRSLFQQSFPSGWRAE